MTCLYCMQCVFISYRTDTSSLASVCILRAFKKLLKGIVMHQLTNSICACIYMVGVHKLSGKMVFHVIWQKPWWKRRRKKTEWESNYSYDQIKMGKRKRDRDSGGIFIRHKNRCCMLIAFNNFLEYSITLDDEIPCEMPTSWRRSTKIHLFPNRIDTFFVLHMNKIDVSRFVCVCVGTQWIIIYQGEQIKVWSWQKCN